MATVEIAANQWVIKFDGSYIASLGGARVVLYHRDKETIALKFKLEFPCSNNTIEYKTYLMGLATTLEIGIQHLRLVGDFNLAVCQAKESFSLKEPALALYRALAQRMEGKFCTFEIEHTQRSENGYTNALVTWSLLGHM